MAPQDESLLEAEKHGFGAERSSSARAEGSARKRRSSARDITIGMDENEPLLTRHKPAEDREAAASAAAKVTPEVAVEDGPGKRLLGAIDRSALLSSAVALLAAVAVGVACVTCFGLRLDSRLANSIEARRAAGSVLPLRFGLASRLCSHAAPPLSPSRGHASRRPLVSDLRLCCVRAWDCWSASIDPRGSEPAADRRR
jgi:hypothetical protein